MFVTFDHSLLKWNGWETICYRFLLAFLDLTAHFLNICVTQNARKRCCWHYNIWPITLLLQVKIVYRRLWGNVQCQHQNSSNNAKYLIFYCRKVESTRKGKLRRLFGRFRTLRWRPGETVQNLESPIFALIYSAIICEQESKDCARSMSFQHNLQPHCFQLWCLSGVLTSPYIHNSNFSGAIANKVVKLTKWIR